MGYQAPFRCLTGEDLALASALIALESERGQGAPPSLTTATAG